MSEQPSDDESQREKESDRLINSFLGGEARQVSEGHRSGYVAVVGKPNVGKSTLINALVGRKVAITSDKAQTTRRRILGILSRDDAQVLFVDTPGMHQPRQALNRYMMREAEAALDDCDAILFVTDVSRMPTDDDQRVAQRIARLDQPTVLAMNKADALDPRNVVKHVAAHEALLRDSPLVTDDPSQVTSHESQAMLTSATRGDNLDKLLAMIIATLPEGPAYYPASQVTDQTERVLAAEFIREQALRFLEQEVPHGIVVAIDEWQPRPNGLIFIGATVFVERDSQKGILIGKGGEMLKKIGANARKEIERELGAKVFLELWAKVREGWRSDDALVTRFLEGNA
jgi:GTP-binding protein Era